MLIVAAAIAIVGAAGERLFHPAPVQAVGLGIALSLASTALNGGLALAMLRKAAQVRSIALEADAKHLITDVWTSVGVVVGLVGVHFTGWLWLDPVVAVCVAGNIVREGVSLVVALGRRADGHGRRARGARADRPHAGRVRGAADPLRPRRHAARRPAPLRRPAHARAGGLDAGPRRRAARAKSSAR